MNIPITQTKSWQKLQDDLGIISFFEKEEHYQYLAIRKKSLTGNYLYLPYGPVADSKESFKDAIKSLRALAKKENIDFIRVEPQNQEFVKLLPSKTVKSIDLNPKETWLIDLTGTEDDLKKKIPSRLLRYYKNASKNHIEILIGRRSDDIDYLVDMQAALASKKGINTFSKTYLKTELAQPFATLYLVKQGSEIIASGLVFDDNTTRYNLQGAQTEYAKKLHATGILTIQLMLDAQKKGLKTFDFWGIAPDGAGPEHPWYGFTSFKKSFDGHEAHYAGTHDIIIHPARYKAYQLSRRFNRFIRR